VAFNWIDEEVRDTDATVTDATLGVIVVVGLVGFDELPHAAAKAALAASKMLIN
jgi:hypothetical protein